jgi:hypothetical protein
MKAAVVSSFGSAPRYEEFPAPAAAGAGDMVIDVIAAGLHPRVRSQADGSHYTSTGQLPLVPGIDGVGRGPDGLLRYFILPDTAMGAMAEQTVIDTRRSVVLPESSDSVAVAAAMNPAMSSWVALRQRVQFQAGHRRRGNRRSWTRRSCRCRAASRPRPWRAPRRPSTAGAGCESPSPRRCRLCTARCLRRRRSCVCRRCGRARIPFRSTAVTEEPSCYASVAGSAFRIRALMSPRKAFLDL